MVWSESLIVDALLLLVAIIFIYLTYNASVRLAKQKTVSRFWLFALRSVTLGETIVIIYAIVDIPWTIIVLYFPELIGLGIFKYLFIYAILSAIIVAPAVNQILKVPFAQREREKSLLVEERNNLLQELKIVTSKFLRKEVSEKVFVEISRDIEARIVRVEAKLEKMRLETEPKGIKELFTP